MRVLIAEDDKTSRMTLSACLRSWGYAVVPVENGQAALAALAAPDGPHLAVLDWEMPGMDGIEVCTRLRAARDVPFRYLIVLTGRDREEDIVTALEAGADDYIAKPWTPGELRARLGVGQRVTLLHEQLEDKNRQLALAAQTDYLTQIWNRSAVMKRLEEELARSTRERTALAVLMLDVDHFKQVNDTYGHGAGDRVLQEVSHRLRDACRPYDVVGRYGGEEFLAIIAHASYEDTAALSERFREAVAETPVQTAEAPVAVTVSVGGVWSGPGHSSAMQTLTKEADDMLYRAKQLGRNRVELRALNEPGTSPERADQT